MRIALEQFAGMIPKVSPRLLQDQNAVLAENCDFRSGKIIPSNGLTEVLLLGPNPKRTIFKYGAGWLSFADVVDIVMSQVNGANSRYYYTGTGSPKQNDTTGTERDLGITPPAQKIPQNDFLGTQGDEIVDSVSYVYTYVTDRGEESAPSQPTAVINIYSGQGIRLSGFALSTQTEVQKVRIYRLSAGSSGADFMLLTEETLTNTLTVDDFASGGLKPVESDILATEKWDPPEGGLEGLMQFGNGIVTGFFGKEIHFSEPWIPYGWNRDNVMSVNANIVGTGVFADSIIVCTGTYPFIISGMDPSAMSQSTLPYPQACLSKRGIISTKDGVIYPSPDGLFMVNSSQGEIITKNIYTKEEWQKFNLGNLISFYYDDKYLGFFEGTNEGIIINLKNPWISKIKHAGRTVHGGYQDPETDTLYLITKKLDNNYYIESFETGLMTSFTWKSKIFTKPISENLTCGLIRGGYWNTTITLYYDGVAQTPIVVNPAKEEMFRIPAGRFRELQVKIEGSERIDSFVLATSPTEL